MKIEDIKGRHTGVVIFGKHNPDHRQKSKCARLRHGVNEDPVCSSGNGAVAAYIRHIGQTEELGVNFLATQGK